MYNSFQLTKKFIQYYMGALNGKGHGMHSPFVFNFILNVLNNHQNYKTPNEIEALRKTLQSNHQKIRIEDLGAGSRIHSEKEKTIAQLANTAVKQKKYGQLLYRLVKHYQPQTIIELGTSLGITTSYLSKANAQSNIITIEGSNEIHEKAKQNFSNLGLLNIQALKGNFDELLPKVLTGIDTVDFGYIDGNHRYEPTINYFHQFLAKKTCDTILVFDDIHWSAEMEKAWDEIKKHPSVQCTVDIFFLGFVFFRNEFKNKQHFTVRF